VSAFNWVDGIVLVVILVFAVLAVSRGFVQVMTNLAGFVLTLVVAFLLHGPVAQFLATGLGLAGVWARPVAFLLMWALAQVVYALGVKLFLTRAMDRASGSSLNRALAVVPGAAQGAILCALVLTLLALAPLGGLGRGDGAPPGGQMRQQIMASALGGQLVRVTLNVERQLAGIFEPALRETFDFLTVRPEPTSGETVELQFTVSDAEPVAADEERMLEMVNAERIKADLAPLAMDSTLRALARDYARDLFMRGYFSHTSKEGLSPFDRMRHAQIIYGLAGENLALAPTLEQAHEGLMTSPGHRANILNPGFRKLGIGVLDGGIYGKMFVQEFTD
jgi:uncharacterized protein YkwD/uncharacterized membrane protein required for colicin V production